MWGDGDGDGDGDGGGGVRPVKSWTVHMKSERGVFRISGSQEWMIPRGDAGPFFFPLGGRGEV